MTQTLLDLSAFEQWAIAPNAVDNGYTVGSVLLLRFAATGTGVSGITAAHVAEIEDEIGFAMLDYIEQGKTLAQELGDLDPSALAPLAAIQVGPFGNADSLLADWQSKLAWSKLHLDAVESVLEPGSNTLHVFFRVTVTQNTLPALAWILFGAAALLAAAAVLSVTLSVAPVLKQLTPQTAAAVAVGGTTLAVGTIAAILLLLRKS